MIKAKVIMELADALENISEAVYKLVDSSEEERASWIEHTANWMENRSKELKELIEKNKEDDTEPNDNEYIEAYIVRTNKHDSTDIDVQEWPQDKNLSELKEAVFWANSVYDYSVFPVIGRVDDKRMLALCEYATRLQRKLKIKDEERRRDIEDILDKMENVIEQCKQKEQNND